MKREKFVSLLKEQVDNLDELLSLVTLQQEALVNNNYSSINENTTRQEQVFTRLNKLQASITSEMAQINETEKLGLAELKLSKFAKALSPGDPDNKFINAAQKHIVNLVQEISRLNFQNSFLIDHSRVLLRDVISAAVTGKNAIFDRRV